MISICSDQNAQAVTSLHTFALRPTGCALRNPIRQHPNIFVSIVNGSVVRLEKRGVKEIAPV